jgi:hypothetical protein
VWTSYHADLREFQLAEAALLGVPAPVDPFEAMEARLAGGQQQVQQAQQQQAQQQPLLQQICLDGPPEPERQASSALPADQRQRGTEAGAAEAEAQPVSGGAGKQQALGRSSAAVHGG